MSDLFQHHGDRLRRSIAPLADRMRPRSLDDFVGQEAILGPGRLLRRAIAADRVGNLILHGPPGTGKTTLARIIAHTTRAHFSSLNAVLAGVKDLREEVEAARRRLEQHGLRSTLFIDEVHRFNSAQQDALLPWVENGTVNLIGATTENPYFEVNKALLSRARLFRLQPLEHDDLLRLLRRTLEDEEHGYGGRHVEITGEAREHLLDVAGGDARSLLNALELAVDTTPPDAEGRIRIDLAIAEESIQERAVLYDKQGDAHFDTISAFIKSLRGSDPDAALFWLARMVEAGENPRFIFRRMLISAGEDVGLADPQAIVVVEACAAAFERIGLPEGLYPLAEAALYLAGTEKSNSSLGFFDALRTVRQASRQQVPAHLRDAHRDGAAFGDGVGYRYPHAYAEHWVAQQYLPTALQGEIFWRPGDLGWEGTLQRRLQQRRAAQLAAASETAIDQPELLSSSPEDPLLARWLQRQAAAEGERLDRLRQRFWQAGGPGRLDRVLVLEAESLLWALDPIQAASEGEVVLVAPSEASRQRLEAQLEVLDQLRRPRLVVAPPEHPERLADLASDANGRGRFEWIIARQPCRHLSREEVAEWLRSITRLAATGCQARFLLSRPLLGPAAALLAWRKESPKRAASGPSHATESPLLNEAAAVEGTWLRQDHPSGEHVRAELEGQGWTVHTEEWQESLRLPLGDGLLERWFRAGAPYRRHLGLQLGEESVVRMEALLRRQPVRELPQQLLHTLLTARLRPATGKDADKKRPRTKPGSGRG